MDVAAPSAYSQIIDADRVAQLVEQRTSRSESTGSLAREETEPRRVDAANCWDALRALDTTTWPVTAGVRVGKGEGLGNQQARGRRIVGFGSRD